MLSSLVRLGRELVYISERMSMFLRHESLELLRLSPGQSLVGLVSCVDIPERPFRVFNVFRCVDVGDLFGDHPISLKGAVVTKLCVECKEDKCYLGYYYITPSDLTGYSPIPRDVVTPGYIFNLSCTVSPEDVGRLAEEVSKTDVELGKKLMIMRIYMEISRAAEVSDEAGPPT
jgi:hypothetical protein